MNIRVPLLAFVLLLPSLASAAPGSSSSSKPVSGVWNAVLTVERRTGAPFNVEFGLGIQQTKNGQLRGVLVNGSDKKEFTRTNWKAGKLSLWIGEYEGELTLACHTSACDTLAGEYSRLTRMGQMRYAVHASKANGKANLANASWTGPSLSGDWDFRMRSSDGKIELAPARFEQKPPHVIPDADAKVAEVEGTVAAVSGDYGVMHGEVESGSKGATRTTFRLSRFDGIHTTLIEGAFQPDGSLTGTIAYSPLATVEFTATRSANKAEASPTVAREGESVTKMRDSSAVFHFAGLEPQTGKTVTESEFVGKPLIVDIFGTWCPNCHDEAPLLGDIYGRYRSQGLQVVGLSFEYTDDKARNARLIDFFRKKYKVEYPLLSTGTTDDAEKKLPQLEGFGVYPTTIFIDRHGRVRAIHAGFEGAATGQLEQLKARFEELVHEILRPE